MLGAANDPVVDLVPKLGVIAQRFPDPDDGIGDSASQGTRRVFNPFEHQSLEGLPRGLSSPGHLVTSHDLLFDGLGTGNRLVVVLQIVGELEIGHLCLQLRVSAAMSHPTVWACCSTKPDLPSRLGLV